LNYHHTSSNYRSLCTIIERVIVDNKFKIVEKKSRIKNWEIDIVDRKSKFTLIKNIISKHTEAVAQTLIEIITSDNSKKKFIIRSS